MVDDRFDVVLARLSTPYVGDNFANIAFMESMFYGLKSVNNKRASGHHGRFDSNYLGHFMSYMPIKSVNASYCAEVFAKVWQHADVNQTYSILLCMAQLDTKPENDYSSHTQGDEYDEGGGVFVVNTNKVAALMLTREKWLRLVRPTLTTYVMQYQANVVSRMRALGVDFYSKFPDNILMDGING